MDLQICYLTFYFTVIVYSYIYYRFLNSSEESNCRSLTTQSAYLTLVLNCFTKLPACRVRRVGVATTSAHARLYKYCRRGTAHKSTRTDVPRTPPGSPVQGCQDPGKQKPSRQACYNF